MSDGMGRVGFCGLGEMGAPMASRLVRAGFEVSVWNRSATRMAPLTVLGAMACTSPAEAARGAQAVITMLWNAEAVDAVLFGPQGVVSGASTGMTIIDMSTTSPGHARHCAVRLAEEGLRFLDAPVTGARPRAEAGTLAVMVGGDTATLADVRHILEPMAAAIELVGPHGAGQLVKLAGNVVGFETLLAVCEGLGLVAAAGGDIEKAYNILSQGTARSNVLSLYGRKLVEGDLEAGVTVAVAAKDLRAALETASEVAMDLPAAAILAELFEKLVARGEGEQGCQAVYTLLVRGERDVEA